MIKCCVFDLDGTILDTISTITYYVNKALQKFGYGEISEEICKYFVGNGARNLIKRTLSHLGIDSLEMTERVFTFYDGEYKSSPYYLTDRFSGMAELLSELRGRGIKLAVVSNKQDAITREAVSYFYPDTFDAAVGGRDGVPLKPAPDAPLALISELGFLPSEVAFIGDTAVDVETGINMGAGLVIGVTWGLREADELVRADVIAGSPAEILSAIDKKNAK